MKSKSDRSDLDPALTWFQSRAWVPFEYQIEAWTAYLDGHEGLIHSETGTGKTLAAWLGPLLDFLRHPIEDSKWSKRGKQPPHPPTMALWITPIKALAGDIERSLSEAVEGLKLPWTVETRTGDSSASLKARQKSALPTALITTPESLTLLLSYPESRKLFQHLRSVVVDEWHELLGTKRGIQLELALARLCHIAPNLRRWGVSATLGNLDQALETLLGKPEPNRARIISGRSHKNLEIQSVIPECMERFAWAGHLGTSMAQHVVDEIDRSRTTLIFTNTRNQTELWYQSLLQINPSLAGQIALHHGSLDKQVRFWVENALKDGKLKAVVCTSSLDLGVDFSSVDHVIQIGSPKGIARLLQRAGRSGHSPGSTSRLSFIPTHSFELVELAAARHLIRQRKIESRRPLVGPLDCLAQHLVTVALGSGFERESIYQELRSTHAYQSLTQADLDWTLEFVVRGGRSLNAYPEFHRVSLDEEGLYRVTQAKVARLHRMAIGTIASDVTMNVKYLSGQTLGHVEESFVSRINPGDKFLFSGRVLELVSIRDATAYVKKSKGTPNSVPRWMGGRMPLSTELASGVRYLLDEAACGRCHGEEMQAIQSTLDLQQRWSHLPRREELLIESFQTRDGFYLALFPFEGRLVHEGLSAVLAYRLAAAAPTTFSIAINDYGFILHSTDPILVSLEELKAGLSPQGLLDDTLKCMNASEMMKRQFREIARVAGLIHSGFPGQNKRAKHLQASSNMFFEAFQEYDPGNLLLEQARREVLEQQLEWQRLTDTLERIEQSQWIWTQPERPTPLSFPLVVERLRERVSSESLNDRIRKMVDQLEKQATVV